MSQWSQYNDVLSSLGEEFARRITQNRYQNQANDVMGGLLNQKRSIPSTGGYQFGPQGDITDRPQFGYDESVPLLSQENLPSIMQNLNNPYFRQMLEMYSKTQPTTKIFGGDPEGTYAIQLDAMGNPIGSPRTIQPPIPKIPTSTGAWQGEFDAQGNPIFKKLPGTNKTYQPAFKWEIDLDPQSPTHGQMKKIYQQVSGTEPMGLTAMPGSFGTLPPESQDSWFEIYRTSGKLPPFAWRDAPSRNAFTQGYVDYLKRNGVTPTESVTNKIQMDALGGSLKFQQKTYGMMGSFINNLDSQINKVKQLNVNLQL